MSTITLIRHGESYGNIDPYYYSLQDCANILTKNGVDKSVELSETIEKYVSKDIVIISSEYQRAKITSQIVTNRLNNNLDIIIDGRLNEVIHESLGKPIESRVEVIKRFHSLLESYDCDLLLFTHGVFMGMIDPIKGGASYCEIRQYNKKELIEKYLK